MPSDPEDNAADLWLNLKSRCRKGLQDSFPAEWRYQLDLDIPRKQSEDGWLAHCYRHGSPVDQLVRSWLRSGAIDTTDSELRYFLAARFAVTHDFLTEFTFVKGGEWTTLFPFPPYEPNEVLWRLLTDWWRGVGQFAAFDLVFEGAMIGERPE